MATAPPPSRVVDDDPRPRPPVMPDLDDCCGQGCDPCVFDVYDAKRERYLAALRAWQARHPGAVPSAHAADGPGGPDGNPGA